MHLGRYRIKTIMPSSFWKWKYKKNWNASGGYCKFHSGDCQGLIKTMEISCGAEDVLSKQRVSVWGRCSVLGWPGVDHGFGNAKVTFDSLRAGLDPCGILPTWNIP